MNNRERAEAARAALAAYTAETYGGRSPEALGAPTVDEAIEGQRPDQDTDIQTAVYDLIGDLHHYCTAIGFDWDEQVDMADHHYQTESRLAWDEEG